MGGVFMFHYMDYVYSVYLESSFSKAADRLHISQPSLSAAVKKAEEATGMPIFNRKSSPITLTEFGVEYIHSIEQIYELQERLHGIANDIQSVQRGRLAVGANNLCCPSFISRTLAQYKRKYPFIDLKLFDTSTTHSLDLLDHGKVDIIFTTRPIDMQKCNRIPCYSENLIIAMPKSRVLSPELNYKKLSDEEIHRQINAVPDDRCVTMREFQDVPFILLGTSNYLRFCTDALFQESGVEPLIVLETDQSSTSLNFANLGVGATICSNWLASGNINNYALNYFKIGGELARRQVYVCHRRDENLTYAASAFLEMLTDPHFA